MVGEESPRFVGRSMPRREDHRLLTGRGQFVADLVLPGMLHAVFVRSQHAHGRIRSIDVGAAAAMPGVVRVLTGEELQRLAPPVAGGQLSLPAKWRTHVQHAIHNPQQPMLAVGKVRHVGEAIAVVVAESRYQALDAAELVAVDIEPLAAVVDVEAALAPGTEILHEEYATNLIGELAIEKGAVAAALAAAPHRLRRRFYTHRYAGIPIECRGVIAAHDQRTDSVTIWSATQVVHSVRRAAAGFLQLPEARVRCVALDVGGGFGTKGHIYPEDLLVPFLARLVGRPVRWIEERQEHLLCSCHSRDQLHEVEVGFDSQGHVLAFRDTFLVDCGAWNPIGVAIAYNTAVHLLGPYRIANFAATARIVATNKVPNAPYRGAGRPEAAFAMERTMDLIAQHARPRAHRGQAPQHDPSQGAALRHGPALSRRRADRLRQRRLPRRHGQGPAGDRRPGGVPRAPARGAAARPLSWPRRCKLCRGHRRRPVRERAGAHRIERLDHRQLGRLFAGAGHGDDLRPGGGRPLVGRSATTSPSRWATPR